MEYISNSQNDTINIAKEFSKKLKPNDVITLNGDLGAGKTAFVSGLAEGLGISDRVQSPTFTIVNEYKKGPVSLYHFDVYRIMNADEMYDIGFDEYLFSDGVCVIEWADNISDIIDFDRYEINITKNLAISESYRKITIEKKEGRV